MQVLFFFLIVLFFVSCTFLYFSLFTVHEIEKCITSRLGKLVTSNGIVNVYNPGLHMKIPLIQEVHKFDMRLKLLDVQFSRITTSEKKDLLVDFYALWQIDDLTLYFTRTGGSKVKTEQLLKQKVIAVLKAEFGKRTIKEVVHGERLELMACVKESTDDSAKNIGISIADVRIKRMDLPDEVRDSVYRRMSAERERVASETRAKGQAEAIKIRAKADKESRIILAEALSKAKNIVGEGDAKAMAIYTETYKKDFDFFEFYRIMKVYKNIFNSKNDILLIKPEGFLFKYFNKFD